MVGGIEPRVFACVYEGGGVLDGLVLEGAVPTGNRCLNFLPQGVFPFWGWGWGWGWGGGGVWEKTHKIIS